MNILTQKPFDEAELPQMSVGQLARTNRFPLTSFDLQLYSRAHIKYNAACMCDNLRIVREIRGVRRKLFFPPCMCKEDWVVVQSMDPCKLGREFRLSACGTAIGLSRTVSTSAWGNGHGGPVKMLLVTASVVTHWVTVANHEILKTRMNTSDFLLPLLQK